MEYTKVIPKSDYERALEIIDEYLPGNERAFLDLMYVKYNNLFVGYYLDSELIGVCFGNPFSEQRPWETSRLLLQGIAIIHPYNAAGRGGKLLHFFEEQVKKIGNWIITLGSAPGYAERFYLKNGYKPTELKIEINADDYRNDYVNNKHHITNILDQGDVIGLYIRVDDYYSMDRESITREYNGYHSFFVFEKQIL